MTNIFPSGSHGDSGRRVSPLPEEYLTQPLIVRDPGLFHHPDGTLSAVFRIKGFNYDLAEVAELQQIISGLQDALNWMSPGMRLRVIHRIRNDCATLVEEAADLQNGEAPEARFVMWDYLKNLHDSARAGAFLRDELHIVLSLRPEVRLHNRGRRSVVLPVSSDAILTREMVLLQTKAYECFEDDIQPVRDALEKTGLGLQRLSSDQLRSLIRDTLSTPHDSSMIYAPDWTLRRSTVQVGERFFGAMSMRTLPKQVWAGMALYLSSVPFPITISVDAVMAQSFKELNTQRLAVRDREREAPSQEFYIPKQAVMPRDGGFTPAPSKEPKRFLHEYENPFRIRLTLWVEGTSPEEVSDRCEQISAVLHEMEGLNVSRTKDSSATLRLAPHTWTFGPLAEPEIKGTTSIAACLLPVFSRWEGSQKAVTLVRDRMGRLVRHDPFPRNLLMQHRVVMGSAGTGKSYITSNLDLIPFAARKNTEILILETGSSYGELTRALGGQSWAPTLDHPVRVNPLALPQGFSEMDEFHQELELRYKVNFVTQLLLTIARLSDPSTSDTARTALGPIVYRILKTLPHPDLQSVYDVIVGYQNPQDPEAERIIKLLSVALTAYVVDQNGQAGLYAHVFQGDDLANADASILHFDLMNLSPDQPLREALALCILCDVFYRRLYRRDGKERIFVLDEGWSLLCPQWMDESSPVAQAVQTFWRETRKFLGAGILIGQSFADVQDSAVGRAMLANSAIQYMLRHERYTRNEKALTDASFSLCAQDEIFRLQSSWGKYSEILMKEGIEMGVVRVPHSPLMHWITSIHPRDVQLRKRFMSTYHEDQGHERLAVLALLAECYPQGSDQEGREMSDSDAERFCREWADRYHRFSLLVESGAPIPLDFK